MKTRAEHYYQRGYADGVADKFCAVPSEPDYVRGYLAGCRAADRPADDTGSYPAFAGGE